MFDKLNGSLITLLEKVKPPQVLPDLAIAKSDPFDDFGDSIVFEALLDAGFNDTFVSEMKGVIKDVLKASHEEMLSQINVELNDEAYSEMAEDYFMDRFYKGGVLLTINDSLRDEIGAKIAAAYREGATTKTVSEIIKDALKGIHEIETFQAERIARSENMLASTRGTMHTWRKLGTNKWELETFAATCPLCKAIALGGRPSDHGGKDDPDEPEFHGNPYTDAEMEYLAALTGFDDWLPHPNCACVWLPYAEDAIELKGFEDNARKLQSEIRDSAIAQQHAGQ